MRRWLIGFLVISAAFTLTAFAGWEKNDVGWWYTHEDGSYTMNDWEQIEGKYYYFDGNGYMLHDTVTPDGYYVGSDGVWVDQKTDLAGKVQSANSYMREYSDFDIVYSVPATWIRKESKDYIGYIAPKGVLQIRKRECKDISDMDDSRLELLLNTHVVGQKGSFQNYRLKKSNVSRINESVIFDIEATCTVSGLDSNMKTHFIYTSDSEIGFMMVDYTNGFNSITYANDYDAIVNSVIVS